MGGSLCVCMVCGFSSCCIAVCLFDFYTSRLQVEGSFFYLAVSNRRQCSKIDIMMGGNAFVLYVWRVNIAVYLCMK